MRPRARPNACRWPHAWKNGCILEQPKIILLVAREPEKAKTYSFIDTVIVKPLKASTVAACLQEEHIGG